MSTATNNNRTLAGRLREFTADPAAFRRELVIDSTPPAALGDVCEAWQAEDFAALDPAWRRLAGQKCESTTTRAYLERPRGHSKTSDLAAMVAWVLAFSPKRLSGVAAAADADQAALLRTAIDKLVDLNPWLRQLIEVNRYTIENPRTKSTLEILSADVASSWGHLPDFVVADELTVWPRPELWHSLFSASAKRPGCVLVIISNAGTGMGTSWQWHLREAARTGDGWYFHSLDGPHASWITEATLAEQKRILPTIAYSRLWLNRWTTGAGDALEPADIEAALSHGIDQLDAAESGYAYGAGLDLGLKKDAAALVIVSRHVSTGRFRLAKVRSWRPVAGRKVDLAEVEAGIVDEHKRFAFTTGMADPWQGDYLISRLKAAGIPFDLHPFTEPNLDAIARHFVNQFTERNVTLFDHPHLTPELGQTSVVEKTSGKLRLEWPRSEHGHGDHATAFSLALWAAKGSHASDARPCVAPVPGTADFERMENAIRERTARWSLI